MPHKRLFQIEFTRSPSEPTHEPFDECTGPCPEASTPTQIVCAEFPSVAASWAEGQAKPGEYMRLTEIMCPFTDLSN